jgi:hypothetical protein
MACIEPTHALIALRELPEYFKAAGKSGRVEPRPKESCGMSRTLKRMALLAAAITIPMFPVPAATAVSPDPAKSPGRGIASQGYYMENLVTEECVAAGAGFIDTLPAPCDNDDWQNATRLLFSHQKGIVYKVVDQDGRCVSDHPNGGLGSMLCSDGNAPIQRWWLWYDTLFGTHAFVNETTGRCMESRVSFHVYTTRCDGSVFQEWKLIPFR